MGHKGLGFSAASSSRRVKRNHLRDDEQHATPPCGHTPSSRDSAVFPELPASEQTGNVS